MQPISHSFGKENVLAAVTSTRVECTAGSTNYTGKPRMRIYNAINGNTHGMNQKFQQNIL